MIWHHIISNHKLECVLLWCCPYHINQWLYNMSITHHFEFQRQLSLLSKISEHLQYYTTLCQQELSHSGTLIRQLGDHQLTI